MIARGAHLSAARAHLQGRASCPGDHVKNRKTRLRAWFGFALTFALFARDRPATPPSAAPKILRKISRAPWAEGTFERNRDTRDFAHFSHLQRDLKPVAPDFSCFFCVHC